MQQIASLLNAVQQLLTNQATNAVQQASTLALSAMSPFNQFNEQQEEWLEWLQQFEAHIIAHNISDSRIPTRARPQQSLGAITTPRDDPMETEPSPPPPPFVPPMELDPPTPQQPMPSTSGYGP
ncbi:uncharacterized protein LOC126149085 [Schistocerca cancellata]|uniref:uncharacterized protein LOC126149085 n=1 Tax=Schistocerca cancellata TaxID=274614 RepID=UPI002118FE2C|nr:uncharacterized protein LOC126149085 [Schistocerca cancellata]